MEYVVRNKRFTFSYQELKEDYKKYVKMNDLEFMSNLPEIIHFTCFVCYLKEIPTQTALVDDGILHELVHLLNGLNTEDIREIRDLFELICKIE